MTSVVRFRLRGPPGTRMRRGDERLSMDRPDCHARDDPSVSNGAADPATQEIGDAVITETGTCAMHYPVPPRIPIEAAAIARSSE